MISEIYKITESREVEEVRGTVTLLSHLKSGAKILTVRNDDPNKVFMIAFRTIPEDDTGAAHIMEHSVLCGSRKYPLKDPFVELAKGSLNTFLNAMTYPDKTVYPIASVNDRDFMNLMDVYLDSVFYPNAVKDERIFRQEGWHYETKGDGDLGINGVVYNEMKGAFSDPDSVLERYILHSLFPDTPYAHESGGAPESIPELGFDDFRAFHARYYHPSNSYIILYGDMDMLEKLEYLDREYLSAFEHIDIDTKIPDQEAFASPGREAVPAAIAPDEDPAGKAYLSENFCLPGDADRESFIAWQMLESILLTSPGAVLREALIKAGIGEDIEGGYSGEIRQPYFSVIAKHTDASRMDEFREVTSQSLRKLADEGISKKSLLAALNFLEFKYREEDYGSLPAGLVIGLNVLSSWIYERDPFEYLYYRDALCSLREKIDSDYFECLLREGLIDNPFRSLVSVVPEPGLSEKLDHELCEKLRLFSDSLSDEEKESIAEEEAALKAYQRKEDTPEVKASLPMLRLSDIEKEAEHVNVKKEGDIVYSEADAHGVAYIRVFFDTAGFSEEECQYLAFLRDVLGELSTRRLSAADLYDEILIHTGGISFRTESYCVGGSEEPAWRGFFTAEIRALDDNISEAIGLTAQMLTETVFDDFSRMRELLLLARSRQRDAIEGRMDRAAAARAASYLSSQQRFQELTSGIAYYDFIDGASGICASDIHMKRFILSLKAVLLKLIEKDDIGFALYGSRGAREKLEAVLPSLREALSQGAGDIREELGREFSSMHPGAPAELKRVPGSQKKVEAVGVINEGMKTSSFVSYDAISGDYLKAGLCYSGGLRVLRVMLTYEYLWMKLRVLGGAYGCTAQFARSGIAYFSSFRDPEIAKTYDVFRDLPDYISAWEADDDTVLKYIIGAVSGLDHPQSHAQKAATQFAHYVYRMSDELLQQERDELLSCTVQDIRSFAAHARAVIEDGALCTIGPASRIDEAGSLFRSVRKLF